MEAEIVWLLMVILGICSGTVTGLMGASGVMIVIPALNLIFAFSVHQSIGTSLMVDVIASLAISYTYFTHGNIDLRSGLMIALGTVIGAQIGAFSSTMIPEIELGSTFGLFMILTGVMIWRQGGLRLTFDDVGEDISHDAPFSEIIVVLVFRYIKRFRTFVFSSRSHEALITLLIGLLIGVMSGVLGAGGGGIVFFILLFVLDFPIHKAVGTSTLIMAITASSGAIGHYIHGNVNVAAGLVIGFGTVIGGIISATYANKVDEASLSKVVSVIFILIGCVMLSAQLAML